MITPTSEEVSAGINCFKVNGMKPDDVVKKLLKVSYVRLTPSIINTEEEVDICLRELEPIKESAGLVINGLKSQKKGYIFIFLLGKCVALDCYLMLTLVSNFVILILSTFCFFWYPEF